jgi:hypothetical protein
LYTVHTSTQGKSHDQNNPFKLYAVHTSTQDKSQYDQNNPLIVVCSSYFHSR